MIKGTLGDSIDIHLGGMDLKFPHHECEIAQSEIAYGKSLAKYWMHNGFINMSGEKMSKSLGNIKSVIDLIKVYDPLDIRYFLMTSHYRSPLDFNDMNIKQAVESRLKIQNFWDRITEIKEYGGYNLSSELLDEFLVGFKNALKDDLNTSEALSVYFDLVNTINGLLDDEVFSLNSFSKLINFIQKIDKVFGLIRYEKGTLNEEQTKLFEERIKARIEKKYELSDRLRDQLFDLGVQVKDGKEGSSYRLL
jgi:cysteinyl-tRNA synthetase